jgi:hypothetical protein
MSETASKRPSPAREALNNLKEYAGRAAAPSISYFLISVAVAAVAGLFSGSLLLTVPFVLIPFAFSLYGSFHDFRLGADVRPSQFYVGYQAYYRQPFFGCYRVLGSIGYGILFGMLAYLISAFAYITIGMNVSEGFAEAMNEYMSRLNSPNDAVDYALNNVYFMTMVTVLSGIVLFAFWASFIYHAGFMGISLSVRNYVKSCGISKICNVIYNGVVSRARWRMVGQYWSIYWPILILLAAGFVGGGYTAYAFLGLNPGFILSFGCAFSVVLFALYLPYFTYGVIAIGDGVKPEIFASALELARNSLREAINPDQAEAIKSLIKAIERDRDEALGPDYHPDEPPIEDDGGFDGPEPPEDDWRDDEGYGDDDGPDSNDEDEARNKRNLDDYGGGDHYS